MAGPPEIVLSSPQRDSASSLQIRFEVTATGGDDPVVWVLADTVDQGLIYTSGNTALTWDYNH